MNKFRKQIDDAAGKICEALIPVNQEIYLGKGKEVALCTLGSIDLLKEISSSSLMDRVVVVGRLLSENKGIDTIIRYTAAHPDLRSIVLCGKEVKGHFAGQSLLALHRNGIDNNGRIIGARGPYPILESTIEQIRSFQNQVMIHDMVGVTDLKKIGALVS